MAIFFLFGISNVLLLHSLPPLWLLFYFFVFSCLLYAFLHKKIFFYLSVYLFGFFWVSLFVLHCIYSVLPHSLENKLLVVKGTVLTIPVHKTYGEKFLFLIQKVNHNRVHYRAQLTSTQQVIAGDRWQFLVKLKRPHSTFNPGTFDNERWWFQKGIDATGYVLPHRSTYLCSTFSLNRLRQHLVQKLQTFHSASEPLYEILIVLLTGFRGLITSQEWEVLRKTGTNHLIAIAGLHVGLLSAWVFFLTRRCLRLIPNLALYVPMQLIAWSVSFIFALMYGLLAGLPLQTQRAILMLLVLVLAKWTRRWMTVWQHYFFALGIILLANPLQVLSQSFWLSFFSVFIIIYSMSDRTAVKNWWWKWGRVQWVLMVGLFPLSLSFFGEFSAVSVLANTLAVPWFGFLILPLSFLGFVSSFIYQPISDLFLYFALKNIQWLWGVLLWLSNLSWAQFNGISLQTWQVFLLILAVLWLLAPKTVPARWLAILLFVPVFLYRPPAPRYQEIELHLLDVGQGLSALVRTQHHALLYDAGPKYNAFADAGGFIVVPYLQSIGVKRLDMLMISHGDNDHIGGAFSVLKRLKVGRVLTSVPNRFQTAEYCQQGQHWIWDGVSFDVLWPPKGDDAQNNNSSCVLHVSNGKKSVLLTGDIEWPVESTLLKQYGNRLKSMVLIAPHHGSATSSKLSFVQAVQPKFVLFSTGYLNRFHFPNTSVVQRYKKVQARTLNTVNTGTVIFKLILKKKMQVVLGRTELGHIWNHVETR
ncbi:MAG: DNA internalization-related competence protein ComEC/Rec2 [Pseudomonadota bacterium]|nr:DNA internalization-related competence protein ComEC/Rec2 [Gammaproteobacteria bacterium]